MMGKRCRITRLSATWFNAQNRRIRCGLSSILVGIALSGIVAGQLAMPAHAQSAAAGQGVMGNGQRAPFVTQEQPPVLTPEQEQAREEAMRRFNVPGPPLPIEPGAQVSPPSVPATPGSTAPLPDAARTPAPGSGPPAAGTFTFFRITAQNPYGTGTSYIDEPHAATAGRVVFMTGNWFASYSINGGASFSFVNPYTQFPSLDGGFCCDQTVIYDRARDLMIWQLQYNYSSNTQKGSYRTAFAVASSVASSGWCYYNWDPHGSFGLATGLYLDYPHVALTSNYVWFSANVYNASDQWQTTIIWRIPLDPVLTCGGFNYQWFTQTHFNFTPTQIALGASTTMYWGSHNSTSSIRVYHWDEGSGTIFWNDVSIGTWTRNLPYQCPGPDGQNWCGRSPNDGRIETGWLANGVIGFMWNAGQDNSFPYPYVNVVRINQSNFSLINQPIIWNASYAWQYPAIGVNDRGDLGGSAYWGGGSNYPTMVALIDDLFSSPPPPWENYGVVTSAQGAPEWGDWYASRRHGTRGTTWITTGEGRLANGSVQSYYVWFGRQQDSPTCWELLISTFNSRDFNGDCRSDIAWRDSSGNAAGWLMNGSQILAAGGFGQIPTVWSIVGQRDFNGDGEYDWLWRDTSGNLAIWFLSSLSIFSSASLGQVATNWTVVGTGDFNSDGKGDILWRDNNTGTVVVWLMNGSQIMSSAGLGAVLGNWIIAGTADFDGNGTTDILWRDTSTGNTAIWFMKGLTISSTAGLGTVSTNWVIAGTGDFNGDGKWDIVWRDNNTGTVAVWLMNGSQIIGSAGLGAVPNNWIITVTGDFDGNHTSDLLWRDTSTGNTAIWFMNGLQIASTAGLGAIGLNWTIQGVNAD
jgi:hypothetical protein